MGEVDDVCGKFPPSNHRKFDDNVLVTSMSLIRSSSAALIRLCIKLILAKSVAHSIEA
jgi:hypothetical protein